VRSGCDSVGIKWAPGLETCQKILLKCGANLRDCDLRTRGTDTDTDTLFSIEFGGKSERYENILNEHYELREAEGGRGRIKTRPA